MKELFLYAPDGERASALAAALQLGGFLVPDAPRAPRDPGEDWFVGAYSEAGDETAWGTVDVIARGNGCVFDGWGEYVGGLNTLG